MPRPSYTSQGQQVQQGQLKHLLGGHAVDFCPDHETYKEYCSRSNTNPNVSYCTFPEHAAVLGSNPGVVRTRINFTARTLSSITVAVADALGLPKRPLGGRGAYGNTTGGTPDLGTPVDVLTEPLEVRLLAGPGQEAFTFTLPLVLVLNTRFEDNLVNAFELQLSALDFLKIFNVTLSGDSTTVTQPRTGQSFDLPVIAPRPLPAGGATLMSSTFALAPETHEEAMELLAARKAELAHRAAADASGDTASAEAAAAAT